MPHPEVGPPCRACGDLSSAYGDTLCRPCWAVVPVGLIRAYMKVWRESRFDQAALETAMAACVAAARAHQLPPAKRRTMRTWFHDEMRALRVSDRHYRTTGTGRVMSAVAVVLCVLLSNKLPAQTITLRVGSNPTMTATSSSRVQVPIVLDMSAAGGLNVAALQTTVTYPAARLRLDSATTGVWPSLTNLTSGQLRWAAFGRPVTTTRTLVTLFFTVQSGTGTATIAASAIMAYTEAAAPLMQRMVTRPLTMTVAACVPTRFRRC